MLQTKWDNLQQIAIYSEGVFTFDEPAFSWDYSDVTLTKDSYRYKMVDDAKLPATSFSQYF